VKGDFALGEKRGKIQLELSLLKRITACKAVTFYATVKRARR
jgi:hypothetical protein